MKCYICDRTLEEDQVQYNQDHKDYDPCPTCLHVIQDLTAGYGGQPDPEEEIDLALLIDSLFPDLADDHFLLDNPPET